MTNPSIPVRGTGYQKDKQHKVLGFLARQAPNAIVTKEQMVAQLGLTPEQVGAAMRLIIRNDRFPVTVKAPAQAWQLHHATPIQDFHPVLVEEPAAPVRSEPKAPSGDPRMDRGLSRDAAVPAVKAAAGAPRAGLMAERLELTVTERVGRKVIAVDAEGYLYLVTRIGLAED